MHIIDSVALRCQGERVLALLWAAPQKSLLLFGRSDGSSCLVIICYDSIFILDQAQIRNDWRVKAHSCLFEALLRLLQVSHDVLLRDKWTADTIITLSLIHISEPTRPY